MHVTQLEDGTLETSEAEVKVQERSGDTKRQDDVVGASLYDVHNDCDTLDPVRSLPLSTVGTDLW